MVLFDGWSAGIIDLGMYLKSGLLIAIGVGASLSAWAQDSYWHGRVNTLSESEPWTVEIVLDLAEGELDTTVSQLASCEQVTVSMGNDSDSFLDAMRHMMIKLNYRHETLLAMQFIKEKYLSREQVSFTAQSQGGAAVVTSDCHVYFSRIQLESDPQGNAPTVTFVSNGHI
ncbi:hypothetical protein ABT56_10835 [Photobacterium aquae]|uniref:Uncharacterized protein n=1 Tax=Photobacterium aquae TaxID=1195763 RepID=A0A0J1JUN0_9GAMM|nr:hypothetical protein [Photobacterium aquae]KLV06007.1 hypothetical protein ABT56_10835 [Photobacterium aquae]